MYIDNPGHLLCGGGYCDLAGCADCGAPAVFDEDLQSHDETRAGSRIAIWRSRVGSIVEEALAAARP
jgi:hypothetical protein